MCDVNSIKVAGIVRESFVDGPGVRFTIFCQGCHHNCPNCHNPETHDFSKGYYVEISKLLEEIKKDPLISGVTFSGGEPFTQPGVFYDLAVKVHEIGLDVLTYTGYTYEELKRLGEKNEDIDKLLRETDFLIDGKFMEEKKDLTLRFRGSSNQRYIDIKETIKKGKIVLVE